MSTQEELSSSYDPKLVENRLYNFWEEKGFFKPRNTTKPPFSIVIPPPNVTGVLHMGHALVDTLIDVVTRWKRMQGYQTLWIPGTDHAGISTQTVVEKQLFAKEGKRRKDYSREDFLSHVWAWKEQCESHILSQLRRLGASCDWDRTRFTMDEGCNAAVRHTFKKMYDDGLIYQGDYLVNWDPLTQTALADDEVEFEERQSHLYFIHYRSEDGSDGAVVATTRPETLFGDVAVAIHPNDPRYSHLIGKRLQLPLSTRSVPVLSDSFVDPNFGTGCVKITPAHDFNDYEVGKRHNLEMITILNPDGSLNERCGNFSGLSSEKARGEVVKALEKSGLIVKITPHTQRVGISYRSKAVIEPYLSKQWFVRISEYKQMLIDAVKHKEVQLIPPHFEDTYFHWIENLRDWCISRQLWWGHRIPIWYNLENPEIRICYEGDGIPPEVAKEPSKWRQDEDVLDTWFSSALWPFSTLGWPNQTEDLAQFYPNSLLITGHDILFFWVARMIFMGKYLCKNVPFYKTFLHGLIYGKSYWRVDSAGFIRYITGDEKRRYDQGEIPPKDVLSKWEKMSKSKGNVLDPLEIIDSYGADAMRMALCSSTTFSRQIDLDLRRFEEFKNFANKMWNGTRFVLMNLPHDFTPLFESTSVPFSLEDEWIVSSLSRLIEEISSHLENFSFDKASMRAYDFFWNEFCAVYVEASKPVLFGKIGSEKEKLQKQRLLLFGLLTLIRLMHPMAPFITEEIFSHLKKRMRPLSYTGNDPIVLDILGALESDALIIARYPEPIISHRNESAEHDFRFITLAVQHIRSLKADLQLAPSSTPAVHAQGEKAKLLLDSTSLVQSLVRISEISLAPLSSGKASVSAFLDGAIITIPIPEEQKEKELTRLQKELQKLEQQRTGLEKKLENADFIAKAPQKLVDETKTLAESLKVSIQEIEKKLSQLRS